jgi:putative effector of murein hydrolase
VPIDLLARAGWMPVEDRLIDTLLGRSIALPVGVGVTAELPWHAYLPGQFAPAIGSVGLYAQRARGPAAAGRGVTPAARRRGP